MEIYELRAYIGVTKTLYLVVFTNMKAARKEVEKLRNIYTKNEINLFGKISVLSPCADRYEPIAEETLYFNATKGPAKEIN